jgi:hypothetical protein
MRPATHVLTVCSLSGQSLDGVTGEPVTRCAVYGLIDLADRLARAARNPDLEVSVKEVQG